MKFIVEMFDKTEVSFWNSNAASILISTLGIVISAVVTGIVTYFINKNLNSQSEINQKRINEDNSKVQKEISEQNIKVQREISKNNIDANIIAKSRIEWIQSVRNESKKFILESIKSKEDMKLSNDYKGSMYLLKLYFGPDSIEDDSKKLIYFDEFLIKYDDDILIKLLDFNREDNQGLNNHIVDLLKATQESLSAYIKYDRYDNFFIDEALEIEAYTFRGQKDHAEEEFQRKNDSSLEDFKKMWTEEVVYDRDEDGIHYYEFDDLETYFSEIINQTKLQRKKNNEYIVSVTDGMSNFVNIMRLYLKIEWLNANKPKE